MAQLHILHKNIVWGQQERPDGAPVISPKDCPVYRWWRCVCVGGVGCVRCSLRRWRSCQWVVTGWRRSTAAASQSAADFNAKDSFSRRVPTTSSCASFRPSKWGSSSDLKVAQHIFDSLLTLVEALSKDWGGILAWHLSVRLSVSNVGELWSHSATKTGNRHMTG